MTILSHTHTHTYIYIYLYIYIDRYERTCQRAYQALHSLRLKMNNFFFKKNNQSINKTRRYSPEEYTKHLTVGDWDKKETDELLNLAGPKTLKPKP